MKKFKMLKIYAAARLANQSSSNNSGSQQQNSPTTGDHKGFTGGATTMNSNNNKTTESSAGKGGKNIPALAGVAVSNNSNGSCMRVRRKTLTLRLPCTTLQSNDKRKCLNNDDKSSSESKQKFFTGSGTFKNNIFDLSSKVKYIHTLDLYDRLRRQKPTILVDCRAASKFQHGHIKGAVNVNCAEKVVRVSLQHGKLSLTDVLANHSRSSTHCQALSEGASIIVYDDSTSEFGQFNSIHPTYLLLLSIVREGRSPVLLLKGGFSSFVDKHSDFCSSAVTHPCCGYQDDVVVHQPRVATKILPFLYLGGDCDALSIEKLQRWNIGYVLNVTSHTPLYYQGCSDMTYRRIPVEDCESQNIMQYFEEAFEFIEDARHSNKNVLVHCHAGISRSATVVIAYIMKHTRMCMVDVYKYVKHKRPSISPNLSFMGQLIELERLLNSGLTPRSLCPRLQGIETTV